jgi:hypothetical protein
MVSYYFFAAGFAAAGFALPASAALLSRSFCILPP